ncbi:hypothetical protein SKAU_G00085140 [Synaphobranchus kaupii]|uniref:Uncharacterized protein n=1 Tax=Synaphobranchus kaupii TaxID=118154 RepID=A0A9Q1FVK3_SYNKA|nr:hypothetical protein SKAU_G00085140 [Synaphobranchus kaupii]
MAIGSSEGSFAGPIVLVGSIEDSSGGLTATEVPLGRKAARWALVGPLTGPLDGTPGLWLLAGPRNWGYSLWQAPCTVPTVAHHLHHGDPSSSSQDPSSSESSRACQMWPRQVVQVLRGPPVSIHSRVRVDLSSHLQQLSQ